VKHIDFNPLDKKHILHFIRSQLVRESFVLTKKFLSKQIKENQHVDCSSVVPFLFVFVFVTCHALLPLTCYHSLFRYCGSDTLTQLMKVFDLNVIAGLNRNPVLLK